MKNIYAFFRQYDDTFFAHEIPCQIDYPLRQTIPDDYLGIDYINAYLKHLMIENDLLCRFQIDCMIPLWQSYCPDYRGLLINLYEPVATNAIGLALLQEDIRGLHISTGAREKIKRCLEPLNQAQRMDLLQVAAQKVSELLGMQNTVSQNYLLQFSADLSPRIAVGLQNNRLQGIFLSFL